MGSGGDISSVFVGNLGAAAALGAAMCWVFTSLAFAAAGRRVGPTWVNLLRMIAAVVVLASVHRIVYGAWLPSGDATIWYWLALSGLVGLAIGDQLLFTALVDVGPRLSTLLMTLAPPATALLAWPLLDEPLSWLAIVGITITVAGVAWVALERPENPAVRRRLHHREPRYGRGIVFGSLAGLGQAIGIVLAKKAMLHAEASSIDFSPWSVTLVRMLFGLVGILTFLAFMWAIRGVRPSRRPLDAMVAISAEEERLPEPRTTRLGSVWPFALGMIGIGVVFGPVLGVWLSMVAVSRTEAGIAATLMSMTPVFILPLAAWIERERITWRAIAGAIVALVGVGVLTVLG